MLILGVTGRFGGEYSPRTLSVSGSGVVWWRRGSTMRIHYKNLDPYFLHIFFIKLQNYYYTQYKVEVASNE